MSAQLFACVDCNNFYASCERVFDARIARAPVVVLSNNDGCVISRSEEAKALGVAMGAPFFKVRALCEARGVHVFSSNYELYGDMSRRVMETLSHFTHDVDIYSIDEAFLRMPDAAAEGLTRLAREIRETVRRWTGVPVSVGVARTKTLAKLGSAVAKRSAKAAGVVALLDPRHIDCALARSSARDVWNVGPRTANRLSKLGVNTALSLRDADVDALPRRTALAVARTILELCGTSCIPLNTATHDRKSAVCSRSFGRAVESLAELREAVAFYASRAAEKIRRAGLAATAVVVFASTDRFREESYYSNSATLGLAVPSDFTPELIAHALRGVERIYRAGLRYKKAGVMLLGLVPARPAQAGMFDGLDRERARRLMSAVDDVNERMGAGTLRFAATGTAREWKMLRERRSPRYTTCWDELPEL
jgi:DNA polymerase V